MSEPKAIQTPPESTPAPLARLFDRANAEQAAGEARKAELTCREIIALDDAHIGAWHLLGILALRAGDAVSALSSLERAVALAPGRADCRSSLGFVLAALGRRVDAEAAFRKAIELDPNYFEALFQLGNLHMQKQRFAEAEIFYRRALALISDHSPTHNNLGLALGEQRRLDEAAGHFRRATEIQPGYAEAHANLGHTLRLAGHPQEAEAACRRALAVAPGMFVAQYNRGLALQDLGRLDEALACFRSAAPTDPNYPMALASEAMLHLLRGNFAEGWPKYEARWRVGDLPPRNFSEPQWRGQPLAGKTILLYSEQGIGDAIQFLRYVPLVVARGARVVLEIHGQLMPLAARIPGINLIARGEPLPAFELQCPLLSLPLAFGTTLDTIPADIPYLSPPPERTEYWAARIGAVPGLKVGIVWAGRSTHRNDHNRSLPLDRLRPLFDVAGVRFFSLQVGERARDLAAIEAPAVGDLSAEVVDFGENAAAVASLDLVICVDTAIAHLAGALGKPVWVLLMFLPDWRWLLGSSDSPWYPSMRLFRQPQPGDWASVLASVRQALAERVQAHPSNAV